MVAAPLSPQQQSWQAVARLYHAYFTGLMLTLVTRRNTVDAAEWVYRLFRHQHHEKFLSSFDKLGLRGLPDAVACAAYHYLSNAVGGVSVEFMKESDTKAWVRFVPPRWIYPGAAICGVPSEVSRAMLQGWYAHNGVSLGNPRLGFVCTAQTTDGQHGLAGYFQDYGRPLAPDERLRFAPGELPPPFDRDAAPRLPEGAWPPDRRAKARRNYAMEYIRTGLPRLAEVFGPAEATHLGRVTGQLVGAQCYRAVASAMAVHPVDPLEPVIGIPAGGLDRQAMPAMPDDGALAFGQWLAAIAIAEGDQAKVEQAPTESGAIAVLVRRTGWRLMRDIGQLPSSVLEGWNGLFEGALAVHNRFLTLELLQRPDWGDTDIVWRVRQRSTGLHTPSLSRDGKS